MRIEPPPSLPVHAGSRPPATAAAGPLRIPRIARDPVERRVREADGAELGRRGQPDDHRTRGAQARDLVGVRVPLACLPEVRPSSGRFGLSDGDELGGLRVPVSGIAGDQQAALFGQACFAPVMAKNTYGTGSFVVVNLGPSHPPPAEGLLTSVGWTVDGATTYVLEGSIFVTGAGIQWLRDGLGVIGDASETGPLAASVPDTGGVVFVPAFTGLGSPYWDPEARGVIIGLTRGSARAHLARAVVEAMAF